MRNVLSTWIEGRLAETYGDYWHECEFCGDVDSTHAPLSLDPPIDQVGKLVPR